jgi:hypothetical protein
VAFNTNNKAVSGAANFTSFAAAEEFRAKQIANDRTLAETLHVIPSVELQEAA